jgi:hypothetical protein
MMEILNRKEDIVALDKEIEAKVRALRAKLDSSPDPPRTELLAASLEEHLQARALIEAILATLARKHV